MVAAVVAVVAVVGAVGCGTRVKPQQVPDDLCAVIGDPSPASLVPDGRVSPITWHWPNENRARCAVLKTAGPNLEIELRRYGGTSGARQPGPDKRAANAYRDLRREEPSNHRCERHDLDGITGRGFACERRADPSRNVDAYVSVTVRSGRDLIHANLSGRQVDVAEGRAILLRQIEQVMALR